MRLASREGRWKLLCHSGKKSKQSFALYDLEKDPGEKKNVMADHPREAERLKARLYEIVEIVKSGRSRPD